MAEVIRNTVSICAHCMKQIPATIKVDPETNWVVMEKTCKDCNESFKDIISKDPEGYKWKQTVAQDLDSLVPTTPNNVDKHKCEQGCPHDCGMCEQHISAPCSLIIDPTNRCNLACPFCYANASNKGVIVEYTFDEIVRILTHFANMKPNKPALVQFAGGEPTLHPDIVKIVKKTYELGFQHVMLDTNGIRMAKDIELCRQLKEAGLGAIYLSFDGLEPETWKKNRGVDLSKVKRKFVENCRAVGLTGIMLVVTIAKGTNDHEIENIMNFAKENADVVAGIVFQPVSLCGRIAYEDILKLRYTSSDLEKELARITNGKLSRFYPLAFTGKFTALLAWFNDLPMWAMTSHPDCGFATILPFNDQGEWESLEDYADLEGLVKWSNQVYDMVMKREVPKVSGLFSGMKDIFSQVGLGSLLNIVSDFTDKLTDNMYRQVMKGYFITGAVKYFKNFDIKKLFNNRMYQSTAKLFLDPRIENSKGMLLNHNLFIGCMHFQDAYNMDVERVKRCLVHFGVLNPENRNEVLDIPFCTYNTIHRERIEAGLSTTKCDKTPEQITAEAEAIAKEMASKMQ